MRALGLLCLFSVLGCSATPAKQPQSVRVAVPPAVPPETFRSRLAVFPPTLPNATIQAATRPSRSAPLYFQLNGRSFPLPLLKGTVAGVETWMLVDTGANSHVITRWLAKKAKLPLHMLGEVGSDHTGKTVMTYSVDKPQVSLEGWGALPDGPMLVTDVPDAIEKLGIGVFISPQWLGEDDEGVIVDFVAKQLRTAQFDEAVRSTGGWGTDLAPQGGHLCEDTGSSIRGLGFVLPGTVEGHHVQLLLDTGAYHTDLLTTARAGQRLRPRSVASTEQMYAASGIVKTRVVRGAHVKVGEWGIVSDVDLVPGVADPVCPRDGVVSMDVLKSCVLVLGRRGMSGRCATSAN